MAKTDTQNQTPQNIQEVEIFSGEDTTANDVVRQVRQVKKLADDVTYEQALTLLKQLVTAYDKNGGYRDGVVLTAPLTYGTYSLTTTNAPPGVLPFETHYSKAFPSDAVRLLGGIRRVLLRKLAQGDNPHPQDLYFLQKIDAVDDNAVDETYVLRQHAEIVEHIIDLVTTYYETVQPDQKPKKPSDISDFFVQSEIVATHADQIFTDLSLEIKDASSDDKQADFVSRSAFQPDEETKIEEQELPLQTLYGQDRDSSFFAKQRRIQNESAWLYNRALYEFFSEVGIVEAHVPLEIKQALFDSVRSYALGLDDSQLDKLFASPSERQRALLSLFGHLDRSGFRSKLNEFYKEYAFGLPIEQRSGFETNSENTNVLFSGKVLSLDEKFDQKISQSLGYKKENHPLEVQSVKLKVDALIHDFGVSLDLVRFNGQTLETYLLNNPNSLEKYLSEILTDKEIRDAFDLPSDTNKLKIDITSFKNFIISYAKQRAATLLLEEQSVEVISGFIKTPLDQVKNNPELKKRVASYTTISQANVAENGRAAITAPGYKDGGKKQEKILRQYKSFLPLWNSLNSQEQIAIYKLFNYPTKGIEQLNDPSKKLQFIPEFIGFDISQLEFLILKNTPRRPGLLESEKERALSNGKKRQEQINRELKYLLSLKNYTLDQLDQELAQNRNFQNLSVEHKKMLIQRIAEIRKIGSAEVLKAINLQEQLLGQAPATTEAYEVSQMIAEFTDTRNQAVQAQYAYLETLRQDGEDIQELLVDSDNWNTTTIEQIEYTIESEQPSVYEVLVDQPASYTNNSYQFIPPEVLTEPAHPATLQFDPYLADQNTAGRFSFKNLHQNFSERFGQVADTENGGFLRRRVFDRIGGKNGLKDTKLYKAIASKLKGSETYKKLVGFLGPTGQVARFLIDSKYRKKTAIALGALTGLGIAALQNIFSSGISFLGGATGALGGAYAGAAIGSFIAPGIGTVIGAAVGGTAGAFGGSAGANSIYNWFTGNNTQSLSSNFPLQGDLAPGSPRSFGLNPQRTSTGLERKMRSGNSRTNSQVVTQREIARAQSQAAAATNRALTQQAAAQTALAQTAAQQATIATGLTSILTSYGILIPGGSFAIIFLITLYNLMVINSAFLIPVPPNIGVDGNNYCSTGVASTGCFNIDTTGGRVVRVFGESTTFTSAPISAIQKQKIEDIFANNIGKYSGYVNLLCADGPINISRVDLPVSPNLKVNATAIDDGQGGSIALFNGFFEPTTNAEYLLTHELGHIATVRNPSNSSKQGVKDGFKNVWLSDRRTDNKMYTYVPNVTNSDQQLLEAIAEGITNYILPNYKVAGKKPIQDFPAEYKWMSENIFGSQNGISCGGPVVGNVGNTGDIYIATGDNNSNNIVITNNAELNDSSSTFSTIDTCRWRELNNLELSINANFFNAGNIPVGPAGAEPVKYYANQTHVTTPNYMVDNIDMYAVPTDKDRGEILDIKPEWQNNSKPFEMKDYTKAVSGLVELTSNVSDKRRKVALGVSSDKSTFYLGIIVEGDYTQLREALKNNGADKIIFLDGGNSAAFCPQPGERFTTGEEVPTLKANRTVPVNIGMKTVDNFIKIPGTQ